MYYLQKQSSCIRDKSLKLSLWEQESYSEGVQCHQTESGKTRQGCPVNTVTEQKKLNLRKEEIVCPPGDTI